MRRSASTAPLCGTSLSALLVIGSICWFGIDDLGLWGWVPSLYNGVRQHNSVACEAQRHVQNTQRFEIGRVLEVVLVECAAIVETDSAVDQAVAFPIRIIIRNGKDCPTALRANHQKQSATKLCCGSHLLHACCRASRITDPAPQTSELKRRRYRGAR